MAFAKGKESSEGGNAKRYIGAASVFVISLNPTKTQLESIYNTKIEKDPEYLGTSVLYKDTPEETEVAQIRLDFLIKTDPEKNNGIELISKLPFFLKNAPRFNKDKTKVQVIDKYGVTAWATIEEAKAHAIPQYAHGPANIDSGYRAAFIGEEDLINFLKAFLVIPMKEYTDKNGVKHTLENISDAEAGLEHIAAYFKGDVSELKGIIGLQPKNKVQVLFGVKTTEENKIYQDVFIKKILRNSVSDFAKLDEEVQNSKNAGAYPNTEFKCIPLQEYSLEATSFSKEGPVEPEEPEPKWGF
jgi:hypothetical protein